MDKSCDLVERRREEIFEAYTDMGGVPHRKLPIKRKQIAHWRWWWERQGHEGEQEKCQKGK